MRASRIPNEHDFPLVTIGLTCYNALDTIERAIDSALAQDWPNFELLVVDDASEDGTWQVVEEKIKGYHNARLIVHEKNRRFPGALNTIINEANGKYIAIFDDDDASMPERLRMQYKTIKDYEVKTGTMLVACWGSGVRKYPNGHEVVFRAIGSEPEVPIGTTVIDYLLFYGLKKGVFYGSGTPSCSLMTAKATYELVGSYDEEMLRSEDADFAARLGLAGGHFIGCPEIVIIQYSTEAADKSPEVNLKSKQRLVRKYKKYLESVGYYEYAFVWPIMKYHHYKRRYVKMFSVFLSLLVRYPRKTTMHLVRTAPKRLIHERKIRTKITARL